jgi:hypothetical protein
LTNLLRGVLDEHSKSVQGIQPTRERSYNETEFYDVTPPEDLPKWAYFSGGEEEKSAIKPKKRKIIEYEEQEQGESALMGEIRGAIEKEKSIKRPKGPTKESAKKEKKSAESGKLRRSARVKSIKGKGKEKEEEEEEEEEEETEDNK